jgi:hypothetical protein
MEYELEGATLLNEVVDLMRTKHGDYALEATAGLLSTLVSNDQLKALIKHLKEEN